MRVLVLGANGMIGHRIWLAARERHEAWATFRTTTAGQPWASLFAGAPVVEGVGADDPESFVRAFDAARPDVVINALGVVKQRPEGNEPGPAFAANAFVPHHVRALADARGARLVQLSTDCVFGGTRGSYSEDDATDATDIYGLSKRLGEVADAPHLTIRTSAIGRSLSGSAGLVEWFLAQSGHVSGYRRQIFSGLTTAALAETIVKLVEDHAELSGVWHVASPPISKFELLHLLANAYGLDVEVEPVDEPAIDRSLDDTRFRRATNLARPSWAEMIADLAADPTPYADLRQERRVI